MLLTMLLMVVLQVLWMSVYGYRVFYLLQLQLQRELLKPVITMAWLLRLLMQ